MVGFVQQLACCYVRHGYHYYVVGEIPPRKDPLAVDERIIERYGLELSKFARARRKRAGLANISVHPLPQLLCHCAQPGQKKVTHRFFERAQPGADSQRSRVQPIAFGGYSIGWHRGVDRRWHVSVRIHPERYRSLKAYLLELATRRSVDQLADEFAGLGFEPYAPVRRQLIALLKAVNRERKTAGLALVPFESLRMRRNIVRPFDSPRGRSAESVARRAG